MNTFFIISLILFIRITYESYSDDFRAIYNTPVISSTGEVWPMPAYIESIDDYIVFSPHSLKIKTRYCNVLELAINRFTANLYRLIGDNIILNAIDKDDPLFYTYLNINYSICEEWPHADMNEEYKLIIKNVGVINVTAVSVWGCIRALETLTQLVHWDDRMSLIINSTDVVDYPRYSHRGVLLDTSRHFIPTAVLIQNLEAMAQNKMNVFHWHIVDDQSFPFFSETFPELSQKGAYSNKHFYSTRDVEMVIQEARYRGIRVMVEFDTPGHTLSWGKSFPSLLTQCYEKDSKNQTFPASLSGPLDPISNDTYEFLDKFFTEVLRRFPDKFIHLGGDEVIFSCWASNPKIQDFMKHNNWNTSFALLENYFIERLITMLRARDPTRRYVVWQEIFDNGLKLAKDTIVHVWKQANWSTELTRVAKAGNDIILSSPWYLDYISYGQDWKTYYLTEPLDNANLTEEEQNRVIGGEACLWGEYVDGTNVLSRLWPRASAVAERLWSAKYYDNATSAASRLQEQRCRMIKLGIQAQPILGPSYCLDEHV